MPDPQTRSETEYWDIASFTLLAALAVFLGITHVDYPDNPIIYRFTTRSITLFVTGFVTFLTYSFTRKTEG